MLKNLFLRIIRGPSEEEQLQNAKNLYTSLLVLGFVPPTVTTPLEQITYLPPILPPMKEVRRDN